MSTTTANRHFTLSFDMTRVFSNAGFGGDLPDMPVIDRDWPMRTVQFLAFVDRFII